MTFDVTSNQAWTVEVPEWCTVSPASGSGDTTVRVVIMANYGFAARQTTVTVTAGDMTKNIAVSQPPMVETVLIPAGAFQMGSPDNEPCRWSDEVQHPVTLTRDFYMGKYEITNAQYAELLNVNGIDGTGTKAEIQNGEILLIDDGSNGMTWSGSCWEPAPDKADFPVIYVSWYGAKAFAEWAGGSLPTEAQWEYACRGDYPNKATETATKPFGLGDGTKLVDGMASFNAHFPYDLSHNPPCAYYDDAGTWLGATCAVGSYQPNNYGLYDMHGNVWEWCEDSYGYDNYFTLPATDPVCTTGGYRVVRGGGFQNDAEYCRSAWRNRDSPETCSYDMGFCVVWVQ
jgi:formylglycine-generating enzyme required for sulfatase activity